MRKVAGMGMRGAGLGTMLIALWVCQGCGVDRETEREARPPAGRKHRVIFNGDSAALLYPHANTVEGFLTPRFRPLLGTPVTTISWCIYAGAPLYDSRIQPRFIDVHQEPPQDHEQYLPNLKALIESGNCPLKILTEFAHENGMEAFASIRMNDVHDSFWPGLMDPWKREHPELRVSSRRGLQFSVIDEPAFPGSRIAALYSSALDFSHQEVRDRRFEIIEEVCQRYDIDGVELDFIRHPVLFKSTFEGRPISADETTLMTSFIRRIRDRMDEIGDDRGRPLLLAARVPDDFELSLGVGLDLKTWMQEGLLDLLIAGGGYAPFTLPVEELTRVAHSYEVPVYPCINNPGSDVMGSRALEKTRALATNWYAAGADGIYFWNLASPWDDMYEDDAGWRKLLQKVYAVLDGIGDPEALKGKEKLYSAGAPVWFPYAFISSMSALPVKLEQGVSRQVRLTVGDNPEHLPRAGAPGSAELILELEGPLRKDGLEIRLNGTTLKVAKPLILDTGEATFQVQVSVGAPELQQGENLLEASLRAGPAPSSPVVLSRLLLRVNPGNSR